MPAGILPRGSWGQTKPPPSTALDWGNPITSGLQLVLPFNEAGGRTVRDAVRGSVIVPSGGSFVPSVRGMAWSLEPYGSSYYMVAPTTQYSTSASLTVFLDIVMPVRNYPSHQRWLSTAPTSDASGLADWSFAVDVSTARILFVGLTSSDSEITAVDTADAEAGRAYRCIGRIRAGGTVDLFVNGKKIVGGAITTRRTGVAELQIGRFNGTYGQYGGGIYSRLYIWSRALTDTEALSITADPDGIYAPPVWRRFFFSGSGAPTGSGAITIGAPAVAGTGTVLSPPTVVAAGTAAYTATNAATIAPGLPAGWAADDIHILIAARGDNTAMTSLVGSGWASLSAANNTAAFRVEVWWRRAVGGDTAPTITFGSSTVVRGARIIGIRGCPTNVDPFAVALSRSDNAASATVTFATITPDQAKTLLLALYAYEDDPSAASQITDWSVFTVSTSALGNDMSLGYASIVWPTANSATGALTSTVSGGTFANSVNTGVILSLSPVAPTITGTGAISITPPVLAGTGTFSAPSNDGAITIGAPQLAGTGTFTTTGTGAPSILKPVIAATGSFATTGTGAASIGVPVIAGTGSFATTGTGAPSILKPVIAATGTFATTGTGSISIGIPVLAATGTFTTTGTGAISIGIPVLAGTGVAFDPPVTGTGAISIGVPVIAGTGTFTPVGAITGTGAISIGAPVVSATGTFTTTGSGAIAVLPPAVAAAGSFATTGSGAISIGGPAVAGSGSAVDPGTGSGAISIAAPVLAASGSFSTTGTGALSVAAPVVAGTGTFTPLGISGTGAITVGGPQIQGTGSFATTGAGAVTVGAPAVAGTGTFQTLTFTGTGTIAIPAPVVAGTGTLIYTGSGTITIPGPLLSGYSVLATRAAAGDATYGGAVGSDAAYTEAGAGDLALVGASASDSEV